MIILAFFIGHWYLSLFSQTFFHHRYAAHRMFSMSKGWEKVFFIMSYITQGSSYLSPHTYGILHRRHHAYADTAKDPHSPKYDSSIMKMMLRTRDMYNNIDKKREEIEAKFMKNLPSWEKFDRFAQHWGSRIAWGLAYIAFYIIFSPSAWFFLLIPAHLVMGPLHGVIINWFAHKYGYTNFKVSDTSKNLMPVDVFMLGEGFHNNHHKHGSRPNFGFRWFEFDPVYPVIWLFDKLHIIRLTGRTAPY